MQNLDLTAARMAQDIIKDCQKMKSDAEKTENLVTKTAGVVQENGIYAGALFLFTRTDNHDKKVAETLRRSLFEHARAVAQQNEKPDSSAAWLTFLSEHICANQARLMLVKQTWEQALIYARYGAKAWKNE